MIGVLPDTYFIHQYWISSGRVSRYDQRLSRPEIDTSFWPDKLGASTGDPHFDLIDRSTSCFVPCGLKAD